MQPTEYKRMAFKYEDRGGREEIDQTQLRPRGDTLQPSRKLHIHVGVQKKSSTTPVSLKSPIPQLAENLTPPELDRDDTDLPIALTAPKPR